MREPLNLPRGSVRALLTLLLVVVSALTLFLPVAKSVHDVKAMFVMLTALAVKDYFAHRKRENQADGPVTQEPDYRDDR